MGRGPDYAHPSPLRAQAVGTFHGRHPGLSTDRVYAQRPMSPTMDGWNIQFLYIGSDQISSPPWLAGQQSIGTFWRG